MAKADKEIWTPPPDTAALMPDISGNEINGLGETKRRPPTPVMWHRPDLIRHGAIQEKVNKAFSTHPKLKDIFPGEPARMKKPVPVAEERVVDTPEAWADKVKDFARRHEADLVGITPIDPTWVFEGFEVKEPWAVVIGVEMTHEELAKAPEVESAVEVSLQYNRGTRAAKALADWIREQGYTAHGHGGPGAGPLSLIPAALSAGFGELGKHGSIINRTYGSSFRLAGVITDMPLVPDHPDEFGADDFCTSCQICTTACPPDAIFREKQTVRGETKWYVDFDRCMPYFAEYHGCGICIAVCPWSRPGTAPKLAQKMLQRRARKETA